MTILILTDYYPPDKIGGVGTIAKGLAEAYRELGYRVFVLTTGVRRSDDSRENVLRSSRHLAWGVLSNNVHALRVIRRERVGLVHLHQSGTTLFLLVRRIFAFPFVVSSLQVSYLSEAREIRSIRVGGRRLRPRFREYLERFVLAPAHVLLDFIGYALSDRVTVVSRDNKSEILRTYGRLKARQVDIVPNGVHAGHAETTDFRDHELEGRLRGKVVLTNVGVFRTRKRVANLMLAVRDLAPTCPEAVLLLVGGGRGYEDSLRALAAELGVDDRVIFVGSVPPERVSYYLSLTDVFCLLSSYEGMPMALLEAMRAGKAVVAADGYGMRDLLSEGDAGLLVPVDDIPATVEALELLIRNPERRKALGNAARARVESRFTWNLVARRYLSLVDVS